MRAKFKRQILEEIEKNNHILLVGDHGVGKSYLAKELAESRKENPYEVWAYFPFCKPPKMIITELLYFFMEKTGRQISLYKKSSVQLLEIISNILDDNALRLVIVLDDIHTIPANAVELYKLFMQYSCNTVFFCIGNQKYLEKKRKKPEMKRFFWEFKEIEMPTLSMEESEDLAEKLLAKGDSKKLVRELGKNPLVLKHAADKMNKGEEVSFDPTRSDNAVNLFPMFIVATFIIIASKYLFRASGDYELGNIIAFFGLFFYYLLRFGWWRRR